jgi:hypothetical protein
MLPPPSPTEKPKGSRKPQLFLAMMLIWAGVSGMFTPPGNDGPFSQAAARLAQDVQESFAHVTHVAH